MKTEFGDGEEGVEPVRKAFSFQDSPLIDIDILEYLMISQWLIPGGRDRLLILVYAHSQN